jgi:hypothetical protein
MACTCEDALAALSSHLGLPLRFDDGTCSLRVGDQPFTLRREDEPERLVLTALVADDLPDVPGRKLVCDLLDLGFGLLQGGLPAVARDPETGFIAAFAQFPCATLVASEFPDAFDKFAAFATSLADRLDAERAGGAVPPPPPESFPPPGSESFIPV